VAASSPNGNSNVLPWQAAMDEVKKRKDLKTIMIIGAGPIVIGQVGQHQQSCCSGRADCDCSLGFFTHIFLAGV
jgi:hypothetical protein